MVSLLNSGLSSALGSVRCTCAPGTLGTGMYCDNASCPSIIVEYLSNETVNGVYGPVRTYGSGESIQLTCDEGYAPARYVDSLNIWLRHFAKVALRLADCHAKAVIHVCARDFSKSTHSTMRVT